MKLRYLTAVCVLLFVGSGFAAMAAAPVSAPAPDTQSGSVEATPISSTVSPADSTCGPDCSAVKRRIMQLESERHRVVQEIRDLRAKADRVTHALRKVEAAQKDIAAHATRLLGELQVIQKRVDILKTQLLRIDHAMKLLDAEKAKLGRMLKDPNLTKEQKARILKRMAEIDREMRHLRAMAKDIAAHIMRLRDAEHRIISELQTLKHDYMRLEKVKHGLLRELRQIHEKMDRLTRVLRGIDHALHRLIAYYRAHCP